MNNKTYVMPKVKTRMLRKAIEINENIDFSNMKTKDLDGLVDFIVELYEIVNNFIDFYNKRRLHSSLKYMAPCEFHQLYSEGKLSNIEVKV